jgi:hypothetical protein
VLNRAHNAGSLEPPVTRDTRAAAPDRAPAISPINPRLCRPQAMRSPRTRQATIPIYKRLLRQMHIGKTIITNVAVPMRILMPASLLVILWSVWLYPVKRSTGFSCC